MDIDKNFGCSYHRQIEARKAQSHQGLGGKGRSAVDFEGSKPVAPVGASGVRGSGPRSPGLASLANITIFQGSSVTLTIFEDNIHTLGSLHVYR